MIRKLFRLLGQMLWLVDQRAIFRPGLTFGKIFFELKTFLRYTPSDKDIKELRPGVGNIFPVLVLLSCPEFKDRTQNNELVLVSVL